MADRVSRNWVKDGPTSRVSQAAFRAAQQRQTCVQAPPQHFCPQHFYRGCPRPEAAPRLAALAQGKL